MLGSCVKRRWLRATVALAALAGLWTGGASTAAAQDLMVDGVEVQMSGLHWYNTVQVINGGIIRVVPYDNGPDATALGAGASVARACSRPGVLPWANVPYEEAAAACAVVGKRLCEPEEWLAACEGAALNVYPYGATYAGATCNGVDHDGIPGGADDDVLLPTGDLAACVSDDGVYDLSGNLREWTVDQTGVTPGGDPIYIVRGGEYHTPAPGLTCGFTLSQAVGTVVLPTIGFRCCADAAP